MDETLGEKLCALRRRRGLSQRELSEKLRAFGVEVSNQAVSKWENGMTQPSAAQFLALCSVLSVRDISEEFLGEENKLFHGLNETGRKKVEEYADILRASGMFAEKKSGLIRHLPLYSLAVSAGTGQFLDSSDFESVEVGAEVPVSADFGVRVSGDSMEPRFHDGQTVWIRHENVLHNGEIGVFLYDGNAYLKQLQSSRDGVWLHSLNPAYPDLPVKSFGELRVLGRALT